MPLLTVTQSCTKKTDDPAVMPSAPTTGSIVGTIDPAGSLSTVTTTSAGGLTFPLSVSGASFRFDELVAGAYTLSFTPSTGYGAPANRSLTVVAGATASAGTVSVNPQVSVLRGAVSWETGGATYTAATLSGSLTTITATDQTSGRAGILSLNLPNLNGVGTYRLDNQATNGQYIVTNGGVPAASYGTAVTGGLNGTVTVTSYEVATRTMTGTFGFVAANRVYTYSTITVSNGHFSSG